MKGEIEKCNEHCKNKYDKKVENRNQKQENGAREREKIFLWTKCVFAHSHSDGWTTKTNFRIGPYVKNSLFPFFRTEYFSCI